MADVLADFYVTYDLTRAETLRILAAPKPRNREAKVKRYNLSLPEDLFREVEQLAEREQMTVLEVLRRSVKLGLLAASVQAKPSAALIIREGDTEREIVLL